MNMIDHTTARDVAADTAAVVCQRFAVIDMTCGHCEHAVATEVGRLAGVVTAVANAFAGTVTIDGSRELGVAEVRLPSTTPVVSWSDEHHHRSMQRGQPNKRPPGTTELPATPTSSRSASTAPTSSASRWPSPMCAPTWPC